MGFYILYYKPPSVDLRVNIYCYLKAFTCLFYDTQECYLDILYIFAFFIFIVILHLYSLLSFKT